MTPIALTSASLAELTLQQTLSQYRQHFGWSGGELALAIGLPPTTLDTRLQLQWQGLSLPLWCYGAELAHWLAPDLQQAELFSLPEPLQLALIERLGQPLGGLTCSALTRQESRDKADEPALQLLLQREGASLALWLPQPEPLLNRLPPRPQQQRLPLPLTLSLQWGEMGLTLDELATLAIGDVLLPPPHPQLGQQLLICVEGRPFAYCQPHQQHLELTAMHNAEPADPFGPTELEQLPIQVSFEVGRQTLDWHTLTSLQPGALIDLGSPLDGEVRIISNGHSLGVGRLVEIQGRLGVRVERLGNESQP
ncbi:TPA: type III secretion system cytoplasmic ring protein SctQ [Aeromonas hydrophila]|uniref:type III secretion system cytoplasmic ring protein SctQ n=1 Tax=Aeromonas hydrophila TaxID=644 RepID=UPI000FD173D4|nr:type III secretion system cytoplasmic ring protein SctQ [Aeromonas hydrophila]AZU48863.1 type III secretion system protein [Aeromonas hydrophila]MCV3294966.1 YscQ/HrcQ family type III secretion apparatus protein [Aeromonas hydrophila]QBX70688.1 YscQ/HrcQ family type III secretion apparatus protein [Aeromonas hydrophila]QBX75413.1 YscQ/HrcQ family type III secretion apparatus protein [Aeromonas hydrophila]